uniref:Uncharacterized protein n=1 Tax=viral metagenome TaxID=1070528 RepID=A0A6C0H3M5_9ZZZZ
MNISENQHLFSSISVEQQITASIDLFYIGTFIGLASGFLCACVIAHANYIKKKRALPSLPIEVSI